MASNDNDTRTVMIRENVLITTCDGKVCIQMAPNKDQYILYWQFFIVGLIISSYPKRKRACRKVWFNASLTAGKL